MTTKFEEEFLAKLSPEQLAEVKKAVDAKHAQQTGQAQTDEADRKTLANGSDADARKLVRDKYGYTPNF